MTPADDKSASDITPIRIVRAKDLPIGIQVWLSDMLDGELPETFCCSPIELSELRESMTSQLDNWDSDDFAKALEYARLWLGGSTPPPIVVDTESDDWTRIQDGYHRVWAAHCLDVRPKRIMAIWLCRLRSSAAVKAC